MERNNQNGNKPVAGALTFPDKNNQNLQSISQQPRQPKNLQGLLRFCMEATKAEDAPGNSQFIPLDDERRKFLEEALKSLTVDLARVLQESITVLTNQAKIQAIRSGDPLPNDVQCAFQNLLEHVDDMDIANDFYKMGGFAIFAIAYGCENAEVRAQASSVLAELCQNNPFCQARTLECGLLSVLLNLVTSERGNALCKCLYAISCATREFQPACRELVAAGGCASLAALLAAPEPAARTKAAFFIRYLSHNYPDAREELIKLDVVGVLVQQIARGRDDSSEQLLAALAALAAAGGAPALRQARQPALRLRAVLRAHLALPELQDDRFREEQEYCLQLLQLLFPDDAPADR